MSWPCVHSPMRTPHELPAVLGAEKQLLTCSSAVAIPLRDQAPEGRRPAAGKVIHGHGQAPPLWEAFPDS